MTGSGGQGLPALPLRLGNRKVFAWQLQRVADGAANAEPGTGRALRGVVQEFDGVDGDAEFLGVGAEAEVAGGMGSGDAEVEDQEGAVGEAD